MAMAYRITYGKDRLSNSKTRVSPLAVQFLAACGFLASVLLIGWMSPGAKQVLLTVFQPTENTATEMMAQVLYEGRTLREGLIVFCRGILEASGYGS